MPALREAGLNAAPILRMNTEASMPWPGLAIHSCSQHIFIEHRLFARPWVGTGGSETQHTQTLP